MSKEEQVLELVDGYAKGIITDKEFTKMSDIILMENTTIKESEWCHYSGMESPKAYEEEWEANSLYSS